MFCKDSRNLLFSDLSDTQAKEWSKVLRPQPAEGWDSTVTYCGWKDVPSVYLVCESDQVIPVGMQEQMAQLAGSEVVRCGAGHMCILSAKEEVTEVIKGVLEGAA